MRDHNSWRNYVGVPLFTYGSLMWPEVLDALLERVPSRSPAVLAHWQPMNLPNRPYPVLTPHDSYVCRGWLLEGLTAQEWELLDAFEDAVYSLTTVVTQSRGAYIAAGAYTVSAAKAEQLGASDRWEEHLLVDVFADYVANARSFRKRFLDPHR